MSAPTTTFKPIRVLEGVFGGSRTSLPRRIVCEVTGGHEFSLSYTLQQSRPVAVRVECERCGFSTGWKNLPYVEVVPTPAPSDSGLDQNEGSGE